MTLRRTIEMALLTWSHRLRSIMRGPLRARPRWALHVRMFDQAVLIVRAFYAISLAMLYQRARDIFDLQHLAVTDLDLLWPVAWLELTGTDVGIGLVSQFALLAGLCGLLAWQMLWARILVSVALLQLAALANSEGFINHGHHAWFWISVALWYLPSGPSAELRATRGGRVRFLVGFAAAPAAMLLFYALSGAHKLAAALIAPFTPEVSGFAPNAMAITLAWRAIETHSTPLWAPVVIDFPLLGWPLYLAVHFIEFAALFVILRPRLHRLWGLLLIAFHFGTFLFLDITFPQHVLICALFLYMSPLGIGLGGVREAAAAIPLVGWVARRLERIWQPHPS